jgi:FdhD protein
MSESRAIRVVRVTDGGVAEAMDAAAVEEPLEIRLHDRPFAVIMRTPGADRELAAGFLLAEGVIAGAVDLGAVEHCHHPDRAEAHNIVNVFLMKGARERADDFLAQRRNVVANSSCGLCGRTSIESLAIRAVCLSSHSTVEAAVIRALPAALRQRQSGFEQTGGLHGAALFRCDGTFVIAAEDVGRHNAVDKVIGRMLLEERLPLTAHVLVVSGRTSFEIVQKAWLAGIEVICAVSAPSSLAVELADTAGITLIGFAREAGFNIYTHHSRIG